MISLFFFWYHGNEYKNPADNDHPRECTFIKAIKNTLPARVDKLLNTPFRVSYRHSRHLSQISRLLERSRIGNTDDAGNCADLCSCACIQLIENHLNIHYRHTQYTPFVFEFFQTLKAAVNCTNSLYNVSRQCQQLKQLFAPDVLSIIIVARMKNARFLNTSKLGDKKRF